MIRLEPSQKERLKKEFGGVQAAIDSVLNAMDILDKIKKIK